jgi:hypothetical protein
MDIKKAEGRREEGTAGGQKGGIYQQGSESHDPSYVLESDHPPGRGILLVSSQSLQFLVALLSLLL